MNTKEGRNSRFFHKKFKRETPKFIKILQVLDRLVGKKTIWQENL